MRNVLDVGKDVRFDQPREESRKKKNEKKGAGLEFLSLNFSHHRTERVSSVGAIGIVAIVVASTVAIVAATKIIRKYPPSPKDISSESQRIPRVTSLSLCLSNTNHYIASQTCTFSFVGHDTQELDRIPTTQWQEGSGFQFKTIGLCIQASFLVSELDIPFLFLPPPSHPPSDSSPFMIMSEGPHQISRSQESTHGWYLYIPPPALSSQVIQPTEKGLGCHEMSNGNAPSYVQNLK
ncbi:hypothetical protein ACRALDRAFT_207113 [Sodiomyces alcalophilus JCM 7366]|uniref:uncharacterized protein n=1 Tax=Sodiomyces alcalophilus JCM 7366 TaxID=591952 RepID=UPI0039B38996